MIKVTLDYDQATKMLYQNGVYVGTSVATTISESSETAQHKLSIAEVIKLKDAGFTADEIVIMSKEKVL